MGLTLAGRLAQLGADVVVYEAAESGSREGSRAICMQRETLETWNRLGIGEAIAARGVQWHVGRTFVRGRQLFETHLPAGDQHFPPFVNISQSEVEARLEARIVELGVPIHRGHRLTGLDPSYDQVVLTFDGPEAEVRAAAGRVVGADGAHSAVRHLAGIGFPGTTFVDRFLIADIRAELPFTRERHFHFDPPWNPGRQVLLHPQPDGVWRIDWQVPPETDADEERRTGRLDARIRAVIGDTIRYELVWLTGYRFSQRLADAFRVDRVLLAGDAAHVMSPFGARGLNSGVADAENLAWKLARRRGRGARGAARFVRLRAARRRGREPRRHRGHDALHGAAGRRAAHDARPGPAAGADVRVGAAPGELGPPRRTCPLRRVVGRGERVRSRGGRAATGHGGAGRAARRWTAAPRPPGLLAGGRGSRDTTVPPSRDVVHVESTSPFGSGRAWLLRTDGYVADVVPLNRIEELGRSTPAVRLPGAVPPGRGGSPPG